MKISILTATYNREKYLTKLFESILENMNNDIQIEWLIMDDGSSDNTENLIKFFIDKNIFNLEIKYFKQKNQGKMIAINNLIEYSTGELLMECDSDDYLKDNAVKTIISKYENIRDKKNIYAMVFLKYNQNFCNIGSMFKNENINTTMFDLYFRDNLEGDKALVYITEKRKQYRYEIEENEKFVTEASLHHNMDKQYNVVCYNQPIMICEYLEEGYTKNIKKIFLENSKGYYKYFKQILCFDMKGVDFSKRLYVIKHYILFSYLTKNMHILKEIKGISNKILICILFVPGIIKSYFFKR